jgi:hypothetical protein
MKEIMRLRFKRTPDPFKETMKSIEEFEKFRSALKSGHEHVVSHNQPFSITPATGGSHKTAEISESTFPTESVAEIAPQVAIGQLAVAETAGEPKLAPVIPIRARG